MEYEFFLPANVLPPGFKYPNVYKQFVNSELPDLDPWDFYEDYLVFHFNGLKDRYPERSIVPFARRGDNDDVACFDASEPSEDPRVIIIHDWASPGWENHGEFNNFVEWLIYAKEQSDEWKMLDE